MITKPIKFSKYFNIEPVKLNELGIVDILLNYDTKLFIDPLLLADSKHDAISVGAYLTYCKHFSLIIKLLKNSKNIDDPAWKAAKRNLDYHEISWTCLGYGKGIKGSGFGSFLIGNTLEVAKEVVDIGVEDVDLFVALAVFEQGIGPDRISDMTTNIILKNLIEFNEQAITELELQHKTQFYKELDANLIVNELTKNNEPILLVPKDIVRNLPIATDWSDIANCAASNQELRDRVNTQIGTIWASMTKKEKQKIKSRVLADKESFETLLEMIKSSNLEPYDFSFDKEGMFFWIDLMDSISNLFPFKLSIQENNDLDNAFDIVKEIIKQFIFLIEKRDLWKEMWNEQQTEHRKEKAAQKLFYAVAYSYCKANNLDLTPEADTGNGPVDFKVSNGNNNKILVEIKLSTGSVVHGYETQLEIYKEAEQITKAFFLVIDVGGIGNKIEKIIDIKNEFIKSKGQASEIFVADATPRQSASKRKKQLKLI